MNEAPTPLPLIPTNVVLRLPKPSYVILESPDGEKSHRADSLAIARMLVDAEKKPNEEQRWKVVREWIAEKLEVPVEEISESMALFMHNQVIELTNSVKEEARKKVFTIASSALPIQESQQTS